MRRWPFTAHHRTMAKSETDSIPDISRIASLLADPGRARMLCMLMPGLAMTASELARGAALTPQAASNHLARLLDAHLLSVLQQGRHRYYALSSTEVAHAIEALTAAAVATDEKRTHFVPNTPPELRAGRTCYNHLAGRIGVALFDAMLEHGYWRRKADQSIEISEDGWVWLKRELSLERDDMSRGRSPLLRTCLDWSERRYHGAGTLPSNMLAAMVGKGWLARGPGRKAMLTAAGRKAIVMALPSIKLD